MKEKVEKLEVGEYVKYKNKDLEHESGDAVRMLQWAEDIISQHYIAYLALNLQIMLTFCQVATELSSF